MFPIVGSWRWIGGVVAVCIAGVACSGGGNDDGFRTIPAVDLEPAFGNATFDRPVKLVQHPTNFTRWYIVEQGGRVKTFTGAGDITTAADVVAQAGVDLGGGNEQGLLGLAFDPNFATSGEIYLTYTDETADDSVLARWKSTNNGVTFVPDTPSPVVLAIPHPHGNHNGGDIVFGSDGFLYYSMGDGGLNDDPDDNGQDANILLGKILRIDVNALQESDTYAVPVDNPFAVGNAHCNNLSAPAAHPCPEIWALGFRNPWRMNFDPATGKLYVGDVGELQQEEIDIVVKGANYGWDCMEGEINHSNQTTVSCNFPSFTPPEVVHGPSEARAIIGGAVYRGSAVPGLQGFYVYGDFETGNFFGVADAPAQRLALPATDVSAFGQGRDGEVYVVSYSGTPSILRIAPGSG